MHRIFNMFKIPFFSMENMFLSIFDKFLKFEAMESIIGASDQHNIGIRLGTKSVIYQKLENFT